MPMWQDGAREHPVHLHRLWSDVRACGWWEVRPMHRAVLPLAPEVAMASRGANLSCLCRFAEPSTSPETPVQACQRSLMCRMARATIPRPCTPPRNARTGPVTRLIWVKGRCCERARR